MMCERLCGAAVMNDMRHSHLERRWHLVYQCGTEQQASCPISQPSHHSYSIVAANSRQIHSPESPDVLGTTNCNTIWIHSFCHNKKKKKTVEAVQTQSCQTFWDEAFNRGNCSRNLIKLSRCHYDEWTIVRFYLYCFFDCPLYRSVFPLSLS